MKRKHGAVRGERSRGEVGTMERKRGREEDQSERAFRVESCAWRDEV
jgi:hypothetical protein